MFVEAVLVLAIPLGLDLYMPVPEDNPVTAERVALGRQLFFDPRLSVDRSIACATCHQPARAFSDGRAVAVGVFERQGRRNAPALINRGYGRSFFWDGRARSLEEQVLKPIEDPNEMGASVPEVAARVGLSPGELARALASYVRSILSGNSPFDRFINGDRDALTGDEEAGLRIFRGKGNCVACHVGPTLSDERLHNTGVAWQDGAFGDLGGGQGDFKTPTLREIARTDPYMHDGSLATLEDVVDFYDGGGRPNPSLDPEIRPLRLTPTEKAQLIAFLQTLSGDVQEGVPAGNRPVDFMGAIHGIWSFEGVRDRASVVEISGVPLLVASLDDVIRSKRAAGRPRDRAVLEILEKSREEAVRAGRASRSPRERKRWKRPRADPSLAGPATVAPDPLSRKRIAPGRTALYARLALYRAGRSSSSIP